MVRLRVLNDDRRRYGHYGHYGPAKWVSLLGLLLCWAISASGAAAQQPDFLVFESPPTRPLALSLDGSKLFVANTPDGKLEIFSVTPEGLVPETSVAVGMEPVAVAVEDADRVWVANYLSDSVSIVNVSATPPRVERTLLVGDAPSDIVFAGTADRRAFIVTAHRGQHRQDPSLSGVEGAGDPQFTTPGVGRNDVWVFRTSSLGSAVGGVPHRIVSLFSDTGRGLAVSPDQNTVYVAAHLSHNQTTVITETRVPDGFDSAGPSGGAPGGVPGPHDNADGVDAPEVAVMVKYDQATSTWRDAIGRDWSALVKHNQPDFDVFAIDANLPATGSFTATPYAHVGTLNNNLVVNPVTNQVYVTNTDSLNQIRFEGPGVHGGSTTQGQAVRHRITVIDPTTGTVSPKFVNQHVDFTQRHTDPGADHAAIDAQKQHSLATLLEIVVSSDGSTVYTVAQGSNKIGVFPASVLEDPNFATQYDPTVGSASYIPTGRGPSGLVLDEVNQKVYVYARFDNRVEAIDLSSGARLQALAMHNPESEAIIEGRIFQYDANLTSGNGTQSCNGCHFSMGADGLAWDLGNPDGEVTFNTQPNQVPILPAQPTFHPMKGAMRTQTLRGLAVSGSMHWRGDRVAGHFGQDPCNEPTGAACSEELAFDNFIEAFPGLLGHDDLISDADMQKFTAFALTVQYQPNPYRNLDNSLTPSQQAGRNLFMESDGAPVTDVVETCDGCHTLSPIDGFFGTSGGRTFEGEPQDMKVAHMRNMWEFVGCFGDSLEPTHMGDQIRGTCFLHDGSLQSLKRFYEAPVFNLTNAQERNLEQFSLAFDTDLAPITGQQITLSSPPTAAETQRLDLLDARCKAPFESLILGGAVVECDLIAKGQVGGETRGWVHESGTTFRDDQGNTISESSLRALAVTEGPITFTAVPPGSGTRLGVNRDRDDFLDGLDNCPSVPNDSQADQDGNGVGDACEASLVDGDGDGVGDILDNCPADSNAGQEDFDGDGDGDACDFDDDGDGILDVFETNTGIFISNGNTGSNPLNPDSDGDGVQDGTEVSAGTDPNDPFDLPVSVPVFSAGPFPMIVSMLATAGWALRRQRRRFDTP